MEKVRGNGVVEIWEGEKEGKNECCKKEHGRIQKIAKNNKLTQSCEIAKHEYK
jgi:hypothetical protein